MLDPDYSIHVSRGTRGTLTFQVLKRKATERKIPIFSKIAEPSTSRGLSEGGLPFQSTFVTNARLGFDSLLKECGLTLLTVTDNGDDWCTATLHFEANSRMNGYNWCSGEQMQSFLRLLFSEKFRIVEVRTRRDELHLAFTVARSGRSRKRKWAQKISFTS